MSEGGRGSVIPLQATGGRGKRQKIMFVSLLESELSGLHHRFGGDDNLRTKQKYYQHQKRDQKVFEPANLFIQADGFYPGKNQRAGGRTVSGASPYGFISSR